MKPGRGRQAVAVRADIVAVEAVRAVIAAVEGAEAEDTGAEAEEAAVTGTIIKAEVSVTSRALLDRIETVLEEHVRPDLRTDGGDVVVVGLDPDNILQVRLTGACQGCSASIFTLTMRVEATLKAMVPEIRFVEAVP
jgi:Fe-S cluster biogenesis protein NfuA